MEEVVAADHALVPDDVAGAGVIDDDVGRLALRLQRERLRRRCPRQRQGDQEGDHQGNDQPQTTDVTG
jgi:hypothetical protein